MDANPYAQWAPGAPQQAQPPVAQPQNPYAKWSPDAQGQASAAIAPANGVGKDTVLSSLSGLSTGLQPLIRPIQAFTDIVGGGGVNLVPDLVKPTPQAYNYQPQTWEGRYAKTGAEFLPGAVAGPSGLIRRTASVAIPALASETLGHAAEGSQLEPLARVGGALLGGGIAGLGGVAGASASAPEVSDAVTAADFFRRASQGYRTGMNVPLGDNQTPVTGLGGQIRSALSQEGLRVDNPTFTSATPNTMKALSIVDEIGNLPNATTGDLEFARRVANDGLMSGGADAHFGGIVRDHIDNYFENMNGSDDLINARNDFRTAKKLEIIEGHINKANAQADRGSDLNTTMTNQFTTLTNGKNFNKFTDDEKDAIRAVAGGGPVTGLIRGAGNFVKGPVGQTVGAVGGGTLGSAFGGVGMLGGAVEGAKGARTAGQALMNFSRTGAPSRAQNVIDVVGGNNLDVATAAKARNARLASALMQYGLPATVGAYAQGGQ